MAIENDVRINAFVARHPEFEVTSKNDEVCVLKGVYVMDAEFGGVRLVEDYGLQLEVPADYPWHLPTAAETTDKIPMEYEHIYCNKTFCLGANGEIAIRLGSSPTLSDWLDGPVRSYLYTANFYATYNRYPFGDRPHGAAGIIEAYKDIFQVESAQSAIGLMETVVKHEYRGHLDCPCGSGIRGRHCHGLQLIELSNSPAINSIRDDYLFIRASVAR